MTDFLDPDKPADPDVQEKPGDPVYRVPVEVVAAADPDELEFANSTDKPAAKDWGEVVGTLAEAKVEDTTTEA